jgi:hypothetical protein
MTSDDNYAPYIDMLDGVASYTDWTSGEKLKLRLGKLTGLLNTNFGTLSGYGLYSNGGVYLESSASANSIALKVDSGSAQLTMKQAGDTIFDFNTATSTAKIAGWTFDRYKIYANALPTYSDFHIFASASQGYIYIAYGLGLGADDSGVILGRIPETLGFNTGQMGIIGYSTLQNKKYFVLTDATHSIANWNLDFNSLSSGSANHQLFRRAHIKETRWESIANSVP